jgi:hypothetical protein
MQYGAKAAIAMGVLLPGLETYRRGIGTWQTNFTTMFEDYWAGALLLLCAWAAARRRPSAPLLLLVVWGWVTGMILIATIAQLETTFRGDSSDPRNTQVVVAKLVLLAFSASGLVGTLRDAAHRITPNERRS